MKYEMGQHICYIHQDKICYGNIISRMNIDHDHNKFNSRVSVTAGVFQRPVEVKNAGAYYITRDGFFAEDKIAASKEELLGKL